VLFPSQGQGDQRIEQTAVDDRPDAFSRKAPQATFSGLALAALGVVFGDIGTSPLYTLKTVLDVAGGKPDPSMILGVVSLIFWTLTIITTLKYMTVAMSLDYDGEGGILALMSLVGVKKKRALIVAAGLFGAALIYGDGAITPAISVLSALEGLNMATSAVRPYILPAAVAILLLLFAIQPLGTKRIGGAFGPVMSVWFVLLGVSGLAAILHHPGVFAALNPIYGIRFLSSGGLAGFLILGAVFLCVTGAEALYADMGHFGSGPIRLSWLGLVFPSLVLNYAGQGAILLDGASINGNIFYELFPGWLLVPMVVLATIATIIASQSIITGAYSMTRQAIQLGWLPPLAVKQTSSEGRGQIYVGSVNWLLMIVTVSLALAFRSSDSLASAYGIAVSLTMLMTTVLLFIAMREVWSWSVGLAAAAAGFFFVIDLAFFSANLVKIADGGYAPLLLASAIYGVMWIWRSGAQAIIDRVYEQSISIDKLIARLDALHTPRVPGTAVFLTRANHDAPPILLWHLAHNRALHSHVIILSFGTAEIPWIGHDKRLTYEEIAPSFWRAQALFGFMEHPDVPLIMNLMNARGCQADLNDVTFYVGRVEAKPRDDGKGLPKWRVALFSLLERNSVQVTDMLRLPPECTVELGRQVSI
jgi:KUP system potassium uptake protein